MQLGHPLMGNPQAIDFCPFRGNGEFGACLAGWVIEPGVTSLSSGKGGCLRADVSDF